MARLKPRKGRDAKLQKSKEIESAFKKRELSMAEQKKGAAEATRRRTGSRVSETGTRDGLALWTGKGENHRRHKRPMELEQAPTTRAPVTRHWKGRLSDTFGKHRSEQTRWEKPP